MSLFLRLLLALSSPAAAQVPLCDPGALAAGVTELPAVDAEAYLRARDALLARWRKELFRGPGRQHERRPEPSPVSFAAANESRRALFERAFGSHGLAITACELRRLLRGDSPVIHEGRLGKPGDFEKKLLLFECSAAGADAREALTLYRKAIDGKELRGLLEKARLEGYTALLLLRALHAEREQDCRQGARMGAGAPDGEKTGLRRLTRDHCDDLRARQDKEWEPLRKEYEFFFGPYRHPSGGLAPDEGLFPRFYFQFLKEAAREPEEAGLRRLERQAKVQEAACRPGAEDH